MAAAASIQVGTRVALCLVLLTLVSGCAGLTNDDEAAIRCLTERYAAAFAGGDVDAAIGLMTDDFVALTPEKPPIIGTEAVREEILHDLAQFEVHSVRFEPEEIVIMESWAWTWGRSRAELRLPDADEPQRVSGKYLWILRREPDGSWRIARDSAQAD